jgi:soluble lytic murein transglycosylase-like protein
VSSSLCEGLAVASSSLLRAGASAEMLLAERRSCAGAVGEAVRHWRAAAVAEPRLGDIMNRRIAQATGGGERGGAPTQTLAGALTSGASGDGWLRDEAELFALEPAPWIRARVDAVRWRLVMERPDNERLDWSLHWLIETDGGDGALWLERLDWLRARQSLTALDRLLLAERCVDRFVADEAQPLTEAAVGRLTPVMEQCLGETAMTEGLLPTGSAGWLLGRAAADDAGEMELALRESRWQALVLARRADRDAEALEIASSLAIAPSAWRGGAALLSCVTLAASLGESAKSEQCLAAFERLETALPWDRALLYEVATQRALRERDLVASMGAVELVMEAGATTRHRLVAARAKGSMQELRTLVAEAPVSYEAVYADRLLRQDGGAGELASKLSALRFVSNVSAPVESGWAADWLGSEGYIAQARSEALLQAEVEGARHPSLWGLAADYLSRNGEFALAHSAARRMTASLGVYPSETGLIPGRVWREAYPVLWEKEVAGASERQGVPRSLLLAFLRRESGFDAEARSSVGARGLMQLLPGTAREVAARHGISLSRGLGDPGLNLEIAAAMIADLMSEFGGRTEVVAAAYSAGPAKARRWIRGDEGADLWLWTEAIPYDVVRSYAREVAVSAAIYAAWLGEPPPAAHITLAGVR